MQEKLKCGVKDESTDAIIPHDFALSCPKGCITYKGQNLDNPIFEFKSDGSLTLNETYPNAKVIWIIDELTNNGLEY